MHNSVFCVYSVVETVEHQSQQLKASYAELQTTLTSERQHSAELRSLLAAERQTAASAHEQCTVLSERLAEMEKMLSDTENRLHAVLYVMLFLGHFFTYRAPKNNSH